MEGASHQSARRFGWVPQSVSTASTQHNLSNSPSSIVPDDAQVMRPWAETAVTTFSENPFGYWVPYSNGMPGTIIRRQKKVAPIHVSPKLKYPMMVALTVATIGSGSMLQALSPSGAKASPSNSGGTGSFQPVDGSQSGDEITAAPTSDGSGSTHAVEPGDTLKEIASQYGVEVSDLVSANGLANPDMIYPGDQIHIPGSGGSAGFAESMVSYTVQPGDTLRSIATAHGVSFTAIVNYEANGISNPDVIYPGQELSIPGGSAQVVADLADANESESNAAPAPEPAPEGVNVDVQAGDTLGAIADRHGVDMQAIVGWGPNGISNPDLLSVGQTLFIPGGVEAAPEPEPAPEPAPEPEPEPQVQAAPAPEPEPVQQAAPASSGVGQAIVDLAMQFQGSPYVWGATGPSSFDCTGFTYYIVNQITGGGFPRAMEAQASFGTPVSADNLQPGDIVFQKNTYKQGMSHAGIYIGNGQFVNAANESVGVTVSNLWDSYWGPRYHSAVRIQ